MPGSTARFWKQAPPLPLRGRGEITNAVCVYGLRLRQKYPHSSLAVDLLTEVSFRSSPGWSVSVCTPGALSGHFRCPPALTPIPRPHRYGPTPRNPSFRDFHPRSTVQPFSWLLPFRVALLVKNGAAAAAKLFLARQQRLPPANAGFRECLQRGFDSRRLHLSLNQAAPRLRPVLRAGCARAPARSAGGGSAPARPPRTSGRAPVRQSRCECRSAWSAR
jgi:hypothetical protein